MLIRPLEISQLKKLHHFKSQNQQIVETPRRKLKKTLSKSIKNESNWKIMIVGLLVSHKL